MTFHNYQFMPRFLFAPDPIDGYVFYSIPVDIHLGIIKIPTEEFLNDFGTNITETTLVGTDRKEVRILTEALCKGISQIRYPERI